PGHSDPEDVRAHRDGWGTGSGEPPPGPPQQAGRAPTCAPQHGQKTDLVMLHVCHGRRDDILESLGTICLGQARLLNRGYLRLYATHLISAAHNLILKAHASLLDL